MSYDINLFLPVDGKTLEESQVLRCSGDLNTLEEVDRVKIRDIAGKITRDLLFEYSESEKWISLTGINNEVQISFYTSDSADISIPYGRDEQGTRSNFDTALKAAKLLNTTSGFVAYDPQIGEFFTTFDSQYKSKMMVVAGYTNQSIVDLLTPKNATRPWWQFW